MIVVTATLVAYLPVFVNASTSEGCRNIQPTDEACKPTRTTIDAAAMLLSVETATRTCLKRIKLKLLSSRKCLLAMSFQVQWASAAYVFGPLRHRPPRRACCRTQSLSLAMNVRNYECGATTKILQTSACE